MLSLILTAVSVFLTIYSITDAISSYPSSFKRAAAAYANSKESSPMCSLDLLFFCLLPRSFNGFRDLFVIVPTVDDVEGSGETEHALGISSTVGS